VISSCSEIPSGQSSVQKAQLAGASPCRRAATGSISGQGRRIAGTDDPRRCASGQNSNLGKGREHRAIGPIVQSAAELADTLEIRIYDGKDADFLLYEDGGDGYAYEHGAEATIQFHWDDLRNTLSIGIDREHSRECNETDLRIIQVKPGHGVGASTDSRADRSVNYDGHAITIHLGKAG